MVVYKCSVCLDLGRDGCSNCAGCEGAVFTHAYS
jgi:hypothetical protein